MNNSEQDGLRAAWDGLCLAADARFHDVFAQREMVEPNSPHAKQLAARLEAITALIDLLESAVDAAIRRSEA